MPFIITCSLSLSIIGAGCGGASGCGAGGCGAAGCGGGKLELLYHVYETSMIRIHFFMCIYTLNSRLYVPFLAFEQGGAEAVDVEEDVADKATGGKVEQKHNSCG